MFCRWFVKGGDDHLNREQGSAGVSPITILITLNKKKRIPIMQQGSGTHNQFSFARSNYIMHAFA